MYHLTDIDSQPQWDNVRQSLITPLANQFGVAQLGVPPGVATAEWVRYYNVDKFRNRAIQDGFNPAVDKVQFGYRAGYYLALEISQALLSGTEGLPAAPQVLVNEINPIVNYPDARAGKYEMAYYVAWYLYTYLPQHNGSWGFYIPHGTSVDYGSVWNPIYYTLKANSTLAVEEFHPISAYRANRQNNGTAYADNQLKAAMIGGPAYWTPFNGYQWLRDQRGALGSASKIRPILAVNDSKVGAADTGAVQFIDRSIWAFKTCGGLYNPPYDTGNEATASNGGVGSWKWATAASDGTASTTRDGQFAGSWHYYLDAGANWSGHMTPRWSVP